MVRAPSLLDFQQKNDSAYTISIGWHHWGGENSSFGNAPLIEMRKAMALLLIPRVPLEVMALPPSSVALFISHNSIALCCVCLSVWQLHYEPLTQRVVSVGNCLPGTVGAE